VFAYVAAMSGNAREAASPRRWPTRQDQQGFQAHLARLRHRRHRHQRRSRADKALTSKGIRHEVESPGYRHDYQIWRIYLRDLLPAVPGLTVPAQPVKKGRRERGNGNLSRAACARSLVTLAAAGLPVWYAR
jgi:hypothetical protein